MSKLFAGFGQREITPGKPCPLAGFDLRKESSTGVHDPLYTRCVLLEGRENGNSSPQETVLFVEVDLLGTSDYFCREIETAVKEQYPSIGEVLVGAIHTHAAPQSVFRTMPSYDPAYCEGIIRKILEAAGEALADLHQVRAAFYEKRAEAVGSFRDTSRDRSWFSMPVRILRLEDISGQKPDGKGPIELVLFACHPTVLNEKNLLISRDLVWGWEEAVKFLEKEKAPQMLFMNSACADVSTRYTRKEASFRETLRLGALLAERTRTDPSELEWAEDGKISFRSFDVDVPPSDFFSESERGDVLLYLEKKIEGCADEEQKREYTACRSVLQRPSYGKGGGVTARISLAGIDLFIPEGRKEIRKDSYAYICLPFEYPQKEAVRFGGAVMMKTGRTALIRCYAGGYEGYLPSGRKLDKDSGYEDMASRYRSDAKEILQERIMDELQNL